MGCSAKINAPASARNTDQGKEPQKTNNPGRAPIVSRAGPEYKKGVIKMNATMIKQNAEGIRLSHREREEKNGLARGYKAVYMDAGKLVDLVDLRIAFTSSGTPYACVWCYQPGEFAKNDMGGGWNSGSGTAGGYGYHKGSAAVESAFRAAGIKFNSEVGGCGWERVKDAVQAAGEMLIDNSAPGYVVEMYA